MVAVSDFITDVQTVSGVQEEARPSPVLRLVSFVFGVSFIIAGIGLWMVPGLFMDDSVVMTKMVLSVLLCAGGVGMAQISVERQYQEFHFDRRYQQVYMVEAPSYGTVKVLKVVDYDDIAKVDVTESNIVLIGHMGQNLASVPLKGKQARNEVIEQLRSSPILA